MEEDENTGRRGIGHRRVQDVFEIYLLYFELHFFCSVQLSPCWLLASLPSKYSICWSCHAISQIVISQNGYPKA